MTAPRTADDHLKALAALAGAGRLAEAVDASARAQAAHPADERIQRARAIVLRQAGRTAEAEAHLQAVLVARPAAAWAHAQLGAVLQNRRHDEAIASYRRAHTLEPGDHSYRLGLVHALARTGDGEALDEAVALLTPVLPRAAAWPQNDLQIAFDVLSRACAFDARDALGDPLDLGAKWASAGNHTALFMLLGHARTDPDRARLVALHRTAARG